MANTVNLLSYANTYGDWMVTTNNLVKENNNFATGTYNKTTGTLYLNDPTLGLQVYSAANFGGQFNVQGTGSAGYIQNNFVVGGKVQLTNTSVALTSSGIIYANAANTGLVVSNNALISGNLTITGRLFSTQGDLSTYVDTANTFLQANDRTTLIAAKAYTDTTNTAIFASISNKVSTTTANVRTLIDANNAMAYVKGIVIGDGGFSVGSGGSSTGGLSLDGTSVSNSSIIFPAAGGTIGSNVSIKKSRPSGTDAEIKYNSNKLYWEISSLGPTANFPTKYTNDSFYRILTAEVLTDALDLNFSASSSATYAASANAANALNNSIQTNRLFAQAAFNAANNAANVASAGANTANNAIDTWVRTQANSAYDQANAANVLARSAYDTANVGLSTASAAYNAANNALDLWVRGQANSAMNVAQSSYAYANTVGVYSSAAFARANASLNFVVGTTGTAAPSSGVLSFASGNGVTITGSSNVLTVSTPQDLRTTGNVTFYSLGLTTALPVTQGGTGAISTTGALDTLLPASTGQGQVLATNGQGSYFWTSANNVASPFSSLGSTIRTSRNVNTVAAASQTAFPVPFYTPGSGQLRVYLDGVRQMPSDYVETSSTLVTMNNPVPIGTSYMFEVDGFSNTTFFANNIAFSPNTLYTGTNANTIQLVIDAIIGNVAWKNNTVISNVSFSANATAITQPSNTNNTTIATTAFVQNILNGGNTFVHNISGNANTVNNGVYTTNSYANPSWITTIANTKIDGLITRTQIANVMNTQVVGVFSSANLNTLLTTNFGGPHGNATYTPVITVDAAGRVTAISNVAMAIPASSVSGLFLSSANLTGTGVVAGTYGSATTHSQFTVDANGRITSATSLAPVIANTQVTGLFSSANLTITGVSSGQYGNSTYIPTVTVDAQGRVTAVTTNVASVPLADILSAGAAGIAYGSTSNGVSVIVDTKGRVTSITNTIITVANTRVTGLFSSANLTTTGVNAVTYGNTITYPIITVDAAGRITAASNGNLIIPSTQITGTFSSANLTATGVTAGQYGNTVVRGVFTVDAQGRITAASNVIPVVANTQVTGLFSSANLTTTGVTAGSYGAAGYVPVLSVDAQGRVTSVTNAGISLPTANLTGTITAAQLGTTSLPQFTSIGVGVAANTSCTSISVAQNGFLKVGNTYISSGGDYAHMTTHSWYNSITSSWVSDAAVPHVLFQLTGNNATWYRGTASITPTYTPAMTLNTASGDLTLTGNVTAYGTISDIRMKENIIKLDGAMDKVSAINGYYFNYKTDENKSRLIGVIAQEVEQVMPELVYEFNQIDSNELTKAVRYEHLTAVLVEAIKELKQEIKDLKQEVDVLKGK